MSPREVRRLTNDRGVDVVLDPIGGRELRDELPAARAARPPGDLRRLGSRSGRAPQLVAGGADDDADAAFKPLSLMNQQPRRLRTEPRAPLGRARQLGRRDAAPAAGSRRGTARPVVAKTFPLERAADAHRYLQSRANIGKVVLTT